MEPNIWIELIKVMIPIIIAAGAGGAALWRQNTQETRLKNQLSIDQAKGFREYQLKADEAAWTRAQTTMARQETSIQNLEKKNQAWYEKFSESQNRVRILEEQMEEKDRLLQRHNKHIEELETQMTVCSQELALSEVKIKSMEEEMHGLLYENQKLRNELKGSQKGDVS